MWLLLTFCWWCRSVKCSVTHILLCLMPLYLFLHSFASASWFTQFFFPGLPFALLLNWPILPALLRPINSSWQPQLELPILPAMRPCLLPPDCSWVPLVCPRGGCVLASSRDCAVPEASNRYFYSFVSPTLTCTC